MHNRGVKRLGLIAALTTVFPAIGIAFLIALNTFWWCPEGGCSLDAWADKLRLLGNVSGISILIVVFSLVLQFPFVLIARAFCTKETIVYTFLQTPFPLLGWYDKRMSKWINLLWRS